MLTLCNKIIFASFVLLQLLQLSSCRIPVAKEEIVQFHNHLRRNVIPSASDMNAMKWDDSLAALAQTAVDTCVFAHNYGGAFAGKGENLYRGGKTNFTEILMFMFLEREIYDFATGTCKPGPNTKYPMFKACGHYLQIATASVVLVGCAIKRCGDNYLAACEYNSMYSSPPYKAGKPGTKCGHMITSYVNNKLCYSKMPFMPQPLPGDKLKCKLECKNGGILTDTGYSCMCKNCPKGFAGNRCHRWFGVGPANITLTHLAITCLNGGYTVMDSGKLKCKCLTEYSGDRCENDKELKENSIKWYFGQQMRYQSYYPVDPEIMDTKFVNSSLMWYITTEINKVCKDHFRLCCPYSNEEAPDEDLVNYESYHIVPGYPTGSIDGSLKVRIYFKLQPKFVERCNAGVNGQWLNREALLRASQEAFTPVKSLLQHFKVKAIRIA